MIQEGEEGLEVVTDSTSPLVIAAEPLHIKPEPVAVISDLLPRTIKKATRKVKLAAGNELLKQMGHCMTLYYFLFYCKYTCMFHVSYDVYMVFL